MIKDVLDAIKAVAEGIDHINTVAKAVSDGLDYLKLRHPDIKEDLAAMCHEMRNTVHQIQMSPSVPLTNVTGSGGGRARSPGVAQRPTGARNADGLNRSWCFTERARPARLVERLSRL
jgi:hypothetical protein